LEFNIELNFLYILVVKAIPEFSHFLDIARGAAIFILLSDLAGCMDSGNAIDFFPYLISHGKR